MSARLPLGDLVAAALDRELTRALAPVRAKLADLNARLTRIEAALNSSDPRALAVWKDVTEVRRQFSDLERGLKRGGFVFTGSHAKGAPLGSARGMQFD